MSFLKFGTSVDIRIDFTNQKSRKRVTPKIDKSDHSLKNQDQKYLFSENETVSGNVYISPRGGKKLQHNGIKIELIGQIELVFDHGNHYVFTSLIRELDSPGDLSQLKTFPFEFAHVEKQYESYNGANAKLRYFVRVKISRLYMPDVKKEFDFIVQKISTEPETIKTLKMEVGIEDCLHIEFEYDKSDYHLDDVIIGKIYFMLVRIKIKNMELQILRRETCGTGANTHNETDIVSRFEIMDAAPVRGECIPIRLFLRPSNITPTFENVHNKFSVKYFINLVLVDEEERRYFKQQEIFIRRKHMKFDSSKKEKREVPILVCK